ncbi:MAG: hypothetical protein QXI97_07185 [Nitrososphaerota archaeon]
MLKGFLAWVWVAYEPLSDSGCHGIGTASKLRCSYEALLWLMRGIQFGLMELHGILRLGLEHHRYRLGDWLFQAMERAVQTMSASTTISHAGRGNAF